MVDAHLVLEEQRPMLTEFLADIGLSSPGELPHLVSLLPAFDKWLADLTVEPDDVAFLASRLGAYICLYLINHHGAKSAIVDNRIMLAIPGEHGIWREVEPLRLAFSLASWAATGTPIQFGQVIRALEPVRANLP
jgi:hypothetical protein